MVAQTATVIVDSVEFDRRVIQPSEFRPDPSAFVDVRLPESVGKASYSFIGPGVSQNAAQTINLSEPHGFNMGAASMPHGVVNNPHLHYTAEVFICTAGRWKIQIGERGDQELIVSEGDVLATPTWVFRGFENIGPDDGLLHVVLGGDDTGGIIWAPHVLTRAAQTGLYLASDHSVVEASNGTAPPDTVQPLTSDALAAIDNYTDDELEERVVRSEELAWSDSALLSAALDGHQCAIAPVIGFGITQDRRQRPPVWNPHGFSIEWLRVSGGHRTGRFRINEPQAVLITAGTIEVTLNDGDDALIRTPDTGSIVSIPAGAWREFRAVGDADAQLAVVSSGDGPNRVIWSPALLGAAATAGWALDASGYVAPTELLGRPS